MNGNYGVQAIEFLIQALVGLYIGIVMARFLLQWVRADFNNPVSQFVVAATQPLLRPMRRYIPSIGGIDTSSLLLMLLLQTLELLMLYGLHGYLPALPGLLVTAVAQLVNLAINFYLVLLLILVVSSWIGSAGYSPILLLVSQVCAPLLKPLRRVIPPLGVFDLSVLVAFLLLQLGKILLVAPLVDLGRSLV